jgi:hypothetical protein
MSAQRDSVPNRTAASHAASSATSDVAEPLGSRPAVWLFVGLALKLIEYGYFIHHSNLLKPAEHFRWYQDSGDTVSYLQPIDNLLATGEYVGDPQNPATRAFRMPAYGFTYLALRLLVGGDMAKTALILLQVVVSGLSVYFVARIAHAVRPARGVFVGAFLLYGLSSFVSVFDFYVLTESLATSSLVFCVHALFRYQETRRMTHAFWAGVLFTYAFFLRPFLAPLVLPFATYLWLVSPPADAPPARGRPPALRAVLAFLASALVAEGLWVGRNQLRYGRPVFFQTSMQGVLQPPDHAAIEWIKSFGGDFAWWRPGATGTWLREDSPLQSEPHEIPAAILGPGCELPVILQARTRYSEFQREADAERRRRLAPPITTVFDRCREQYVKRNPLDHHFTARLRLLRTFVVHGGPILPFGSFESLERWSWPFLIKLSQVGLYWVILVGGMIGLAPIGASRRLEALPVVAVPVFVLLLFPFVLRMVEARYLCPAYPFLAVAAAVLTADAGSRLKLSLFRSYL